MPDAQYLQNASPSKVSRQQKNEDHESSDEDHEEGYHYPSPEAHQSNGEFETAGYAPPEEALDEGAEEQPDPDAPVNHSHLSPQSPGLK